MNNEYNDTEGKIFALVVAIGLALFATVRTWHILDFYFCGCLPKNYSAFGVFFWSIVMLLTFVGLFYLFKYIFKTKKNITAIILTFIVAILFLGTKAIVEYNKQSGVFTYYKQIVDSPNTNLHETELVINNLESYLSNTCVKGFFTDSLKILDDKLNYRRAHLGVKSITYIDVFDSIVTFNYGYFDDYLKKFGSSGIYYDSALYWKEFYFAKEAETSKDMNIVLDYLYTYDSTANHYDRIIKFKDSLWNEIIVTYNKNVKRKRINYKAAQFFRNMLTFLKDNNQNSIYVKFVRENKLKDVTITNNVKKVYKYLNGIEPNDKNVESVLDNFDINYCVTNENKLLSDLEEKFADILGINFVNVNRYNHTINEDEHIILTITYTVRNKYEYFSFMEQLALYSLYGIDNCKAVPDLITYEENLTHRFISYIPNIYISFKLEFEIPGKPKYIPKGLYASYDPEDDVVDGVKDAYSHLVDKSFDNYSKKITRHFGIY